MGKTNDLAWAEMIDEKDDLIETLTEALAAFKKQWEACGPNSDFGRYFAPVYQRALAALALAQAHGKTT